MLEHPGSLAISNLEQGQGQIEHSAGNSSGLIRDPVPAVVKGGIGHEAEILKIIL